MEIISPGSRRKKSITEARNLYVGLVLITIGTVWMLHNFGTIGHHLFDTLFSWPVLTILLGGYLLVMRRWAAGSVVIVLGALFAWSDWFGIHLPINKIALPSIVIAIGLIFLLSPKK